MKVRAATKETMSLTAKSAASSPRKTKRLADETLEETKDLVTCCICLQKYNNEAKKPKILACFHTFCLECVEKLCKRNIVTCPLCRHKSRKEPCWKRGKLLESQIGNNACVLDNIALRKKVKVMQSRVDWCLTCFSPAELECAETHHVIDMNEKIKMECHLIKEALDNCQSSLQEAIENRRKLQNHFSGFLYQLESVAKEVRQQATENEARLSYFVKTSNDLQKTKNPPESFEIVETISQLLLDELAKDARQRPNILTNANGEKMLSISIEIKDTLNQRFGSIPLFDHGFSVDDPNIGEHSRSHASLLSHLVIDFISRHHTILQPRPDPIPDLESVLDAPDFL